MFARSSLILCSGLALALTSCSASVTSDPLTDHGVFPDSPKPPATTLKMVPENATPTSAETNEIDGGASGFTTAINHDFPFTVTASTILEPEAMGTFMEGSTACKSFVDVLKFSVSDGTGAPATEIPRVGYTYNTFTAVPGKNYVLNVSAPNPSACRIYNVSFVMKKVTHTIP